MECLVKGCEENATARDDLCLECRIKVEKIKATRASLNGWQPIETAPKDHRVLVCVKINRVWTIRVAFWHQDFYGGRWCIRIGWDEDDFYPPRRQCNECTLHALWPQPTHWMPLPKEPEQQGAKS